jgi:outer membrane protein assembly factor BamE (lipoprotein component of BamABCDE complex)
MTSLRTFGAVALVLMATPMTGCAFGNTNAGTEIKQSDAGSKITIGKTTKQQVFLDFGEPSKTASNDSTFFYSWTKGSHFRIFGMGSSTATGNTLVIVFDKDGVVQDYRITRGAVDNTSAN